MTTQTEKVRKLRALARSPNRHEAALALALALALAKALEPKTAKAIAHAIAQLLETRGLIVCVRRRSGAWRPRSKADADLQYYCSHSRHSYHQLEILITKYEPTPNR